MRQLPSSKKLFNKKYSSPIIITTKILKRILFKQIMPLLIILPIRCFAPVKFNQRIFLSVKAINYVDPTKSGFRIILRDDFLRDHMAPTLLPTLYLTAIPLRQNDGFTSQTKVLYPDSVNEDKQVSITDLQESSWYYICVEWENMNRHNETTGTDCRLFKTLDRFGRGTDSTVSEIEATDFSSQMLQFRMKAGAEFPIRLTASLEGGKAPIPPSQIFILGGNSGGILELVFAFLRQQMDYGQLCILEEPLIGGYSALGRQISGVNIRKCHFNNLTTTDYELSILDSAEASPYIRSSGTKCQNSNKIIMISLMALLAFWKMSELLGRRRIK
ncbi:unnamed protein product [Meloidogyne enterolobii]|uniref:Uncharacterized protein n=1 Tax=Meloidogyne enterolobii TaxID=390850 RepID=A0ACB0YI06_MELEN